MPTVQDDEVVCELFTIDIRKRAADGQTCYIFFNRLCSFLVLCTMESYLFFLNCARHVFIAT